MHYNTQPDQQFPNQINTN